MPDLALPVVKTKCAVCQFAERPCPACKRALGINPQWAAKFLQLKDWPATAPSSKKDKEFVINAAIKIRKGHKVPPPDLMYWLRVAREELLCG